MNVYNIHIHLHYIKGNNSNSINNTKNYLIIFFKT
jgi:hypothetical protein